MPSTFTSLLRFELQADGENDGTWGQILNDNVIELVEDAIAGEAAISTTGGTTTLTTNDGAEDQARKRALNITGTLASDALIEVPASTKPYRIINGTSGSFDVEIVVAGQAAGNGVVVPQGFRQEVWCDGTNVEPTSLPLDDSGALPADRISGDAIDGGTPSNLTSITLFANNPNIRFDDDGTNSNGEITLDNNAIRIEADEDNNTASTQIKFRIDGSDIALFDTNGFLAINNSNPDERLHVTGDILAEQDSGNASLFARASNTGFSAVYLGDTDDSLRHGVVSNHSADSLRFDVAGSTVVTIDNSGQVGIGTSSPSRRLHVEENTPSGATVLSSKFTTLFLDNGEGAGGGAGITLGADATDGLSGLFFADSGDSQAGRIAYDHSDDAMDFRTAGGEVMRIDSSSNLLVGTTNTTIDSANFGHRLSQTGFTAHSSDVGAGNSVMNIFGNAGQCAIRGDGDLENTNGNYGTLSDPRLKQDITPAHSQWDDVKELGQRFVNYRLKERGDDGPVLLSVLADDDFAARFPGLTKTGDDGYRSFKQSVASMKAIVALSEALQRIEALEAKLH